MESRVNKHIKVAALQLESENGEVLLNLARAQPLVNEAAAQGAVVVLLPELFATGYIMSPLIWEFAEPFAGPTVAFVCEAAARLRIWIGTSFLEASGEDFYNTFVLAGPDGRIVGRVRKTKPASFESFLFKAGVNEKRVFETEIGRIGIGICYEMLFLETMREFQAQSADLVLAPFSAPAPPASALYPKKELPVFVNIFETVAAVTSRKLGVPVVMSNKCGYWASPMPLPFMPTYVCPFLGFSTIADCRGTQPPSNCSAVP
eukprot:TRINITY_DN11121_c0_g2_i1.p1 TRINITY_DN11121_c0_g2~~TRINITY_DN11121_c0_g2_i1.p1  ORF type:complete len:261 (+),score=73.91 TRINITY_DN11121_c0_g2_i1:138-920(+)